MNLSGFMMGFGDGGGTPNEFTGLSVGGGVGAVFGERLALTGFFDSGWAMDTDRDDSLDASQYGISGRILLNPEEDSEVRPFLGVSVGRSRVGGTLISRFRGGGETREDFEGTGQLLAFEVGAMHRVLFGRWTAVALEFGSSSLDTWTFDGNTVDVPALKMSAWRLKVSVDY